jgi:predicted GNAT family N-acyltransferase|tara:strand:- start:153 stop:563 length:411 start_codon:yes stop_codon:yes gene_type:complete
LTNIIRASVAEANALYKAADYSGRAGPNDTLLGIRQDQLISVARMMDYDDCYLVRHVCTLPEHRGKGLGSELCRALMLSTDKPLYLFPLPKLIRFYQRIGFSFCSESELPSSLMSVWKQSKKNIPQSQPMRAHNDG